MTERKAVESWLTDMDGVLVHEGEPVPGAPEFVNRMKASGKPFLILTNNSIYTPRDLQARLARMGFDVPEQSIWTAALAERDVTDVVVSPIGFVSDHLEVLWDLDNEARDTAVKSGCKPGCLTR